MNRLLLLFLGISLCFSCTENPIETIEEVNSYGEKEVYQRRKSDFAKEGTYTRFDKNGKKVEEATYVNNELDGERKLFFENGEVEIVETYKGGKYDGLFKQFFPEGQLQQEGVYTNGAMNGDWKGYYSNGQLKEVVAFVDNNENGPFVEYYENGKLKAEGGYKDGDQEHGLLKLYDENGELDRKMDCELGRCYTIWTKEDGDVEPDRGEQQDL